MGEPPVGKAPLEEAGKPPVGKAPLEEVGEPPVGKAPLEEVGPGVQLYLLTVVHRWVGVMGTPVLQSPL